MVVVTVLGVVVVVGVVVVEVGVASRLWLVMFVVVLGWAFGHSSLEAWGMYRFF